MKKLKAQNIWIASFDMIWHHPVLLMPFIIIAFCESLLVELALFSTRKPISFVMIPIIRKFFGEVFVHYPGNLLAVPDLFYYGQIVIYIFISVAMAAVAVNIFKNMKEKLPIKPRAITHNMYKMYPALIGYGIIVPILLILIGRIDGFIFTKFMHLAAKILPKGIMRVAPLAKTLLIFVSNLIFQALVILTVPIIVINKLPLFKALLKSLRLSISNFGTVLGLIALPFLLYYPIIFLKSIAPQLIDNTLPEIMVFITFLGVIVSIFVDCFIIVCASQWLLNFDKEAKA